MDPDYFNEPMPFLRLSLMHVIYIPGIKECNDVFFDSKSAQPAETNIMVIIYLVCGMQLFRNHGAWIFTYIYPKNGPVVYVPSGYLT